MCSYNKINGTYGSEQFYLLTEILKKMGLCWLAVSDWGAVHDRVAGLKAGLDLEMPGPQDHRVKAVVDAVRSGELDEAILDESVRRILTVILQAQKTPKGGMFDVDAHHDLAAKIAADGMVLLKNNGLLPLKEFRKIAVIGRAATHAHFQGGGSSHINPTRVSIPLEELKSQAGNAVITHAEGYPEDNSYRQDLIDAAVSTAQSAEVAVLYIALPSYIESEGYDRSNLNLTEQQVALIQAVARVQPNTVVVLNNGAPVAMDARINEVAAVLEGWMMGQAGGIAIADILFGRVNPSGKLAETFPLRLEDTPAYQLPVSVKSEPSGTAKDFSSATGIDDAKKVPVLFPWVWTELHNIQLSECPGIQQHLRCGWGDQTVDVTNTGKVAGKEIVQVYVHDQKSSLVCPKSAS